MFSQWTPTLNELFILICDNSGIPFINFFSDVGATNVTLFGIYTLLSPIFVSKTSFIFFNNLFFNDL